MAAIQLALVSTLEGAEAVSCVQSLEGRKRPIHHSPSSIGCSIQIYVMEAHQFSILCDPHICFENMGTVETKILMNFLVFFFFLL